jgi:hypothetical protein
MPVKIAIMMLVHKNEKQVQRLINHLSKDFDVYVHIDKRSEMEITGQENVFAFKEYKTYWGSFNQIMATLFLLKTAYENHYDRYILISGQDLPLLTNKEIKEYFEGNNNEYLDISKTPRKDKHPKHTIERLTGDYINRKYDKTNQKFKILFRLRRKAVYIFGRIFPRKIEYDLYGGSNWTNYSHGCVKKLFEYLENDKNYIKRYKWTDCADEIFFQTIIHQLKDINIINDDLRYVDWESGPEKPRILREDDYEKLKDTKALFGRKFDETIDHNIIEKIYKKIKEA